MTSVALAWHSWIFKDAHLHWSEHNDLTKVKLDVGQALNNPVNNFDQTNSISLRNIYFIAGAQLEGGGVRGEGGGLPWPFWKFKEKGPDFGKKNALKKFPAGPFFLALQLNVYRSALIWRNLPCPEKFLFTRLYCSLKLIEYLASAVNLVSFNPYVKLLPRIKTSFFLVLPCTEELASTLNVITFLWNPLPTDNKKVPQPPNPLLYPKQGYLSGSIVLVNLSTPNN